MSLKNWKNTLNAFLEEHWWLRDWVKGEKYLPLPPLSRGGKILRNLLVMVLVLLLIWGSYGYPLPTAEMRFRRLERENLVSSTQIVFQLSRPRDASGPQRPSMTDQDRDQFVGLGDGYAVSGMIFPFGREGHQLLVWPLEDQEGEVKLIPLATFFTEWRLGGQEEASEPSDLTRCGVFVPELPAGSVWAEMEVEHDGTICRAESEELESGGFLFGFRHPEEAFSSDWLMGLPYTLRCYNGDGTLLLEQKGTVTGQ